MWKIDTNKIGISAVFRDYEFEILEYCFEKQTGIISSETLAALEFKGIKISRASVINYLKKLCKAGILKDDMQTGKGGYHSFYSITVNREELIIKIVNETLNSLLNAFPESFYLQHLTESGKNRD